MRDLEVGEETKKEPEVERPGFRYSMLTKTGTPLYTAPEMQLAVKYS